MIYYTLNRIPDSLHAIMDNIPASIYYKNRDGIYIDINTTALNTMIEKGYISETDKKYILGKSDFDLFENNIAERFQVNDQHILKFGIEYCFEEENITPGGEIIKHISIKKPVYDRYHNPRGIIGVTFIVDENKASHYVNRLLTIREKQCLELYLSGKTSKETAYILQLSHRTIEEYFSNIKEKLGCKYKRDLFALFRK